MTNEISVIDKINAVEVFKDGGARKILDAIRNEVSGEVPDVTTKKGRDRIASLAYKVAKSKTALDSAGKSLADQLNAQLKPINSERKIIRDELDKLKDEVRKPLTDYENAETERVSSIKTRIQWFADICIIDGDDIGISSSRLSERLASVSLVDIDDSFQEFKSDAVLAKNSATEFLTLTIARTEKLEAEKAELERLRKESEEREKTEREKQIAEEAAAKAASEAQEAAAKEKERHEQLIKEAAEREEKMKQDAIQAKVDSDAAIERARLQEVARQVAEKEQAERERAAREADIENQRAVNNSAVSSLISVSGITEDQAKQIVSAIAKGLVNRVSISY